MKTKYLVLGILISPVAFPKVIYGIKSIPNHQSPEEFPIYVQLGSYENDYSAHKMMLKARSKGYQNVVIKPSNFHYKVMVGPFENTHDLMDFYYTFHKKRAHTYPTNPPINKTPYIKPTKIQNYGLQPDYQTSNHWYVNGQVGSQFTSMGSSSYVNNGSGFASPYNQDIYSGNVNDASVLLGLGIGKRFELDYEWLKAASIGLHYQYFFANNISGQITQFSLPEFQNYSYTWPLASNIIMANGKFNFKDYKQFSPYFLVGLGGVINQNDAYSETAHANITPRISPNYSNNSNSQFAYVLGLGVDYPIGNQMILSAGYQFSGLGQAKSGPGEGSWSGESLDFGDYYSNAFVFGATYLFDLNFDFGWKKWF